MTVIGKINRTGTTGKRVITGPSELIGPNSLRKTVGFAAKAGITGPVDLYEISDGSGANEGTYTVTVAPFSEAKLPAELRGIGKVALFQQVGGVASPTAAVTCVDTAKATTPKQTLTLGPAAIATGDKAWIVVERKGQSEIRYQIALDLVLDAITISAQPPNRSVTAPAATTFTVTATTNDGGTLSYQWQISTDGGTNYSDVSNGGVYTGATTATLSISNSTGLNSRKYRVRVSSTGGSPTATSNAGTLTVA